MYLIGFYSKKSLFKLQKFDYYKKSFSDLERLGIKVIYFYEEDETTEVLPEIIDNIKRIGITLVSFKNEEEIISYIKNLGSKIFINTFEEQEILFTNKIRKLINQKISQDPKLFLDKFLQREYIGKDYPETIVQYKKISIPEAKTLKEGDFIQFPCFIKPIGGIQSSGANKINQYSEYKGVLDNTIKAINQLKEKKLENQEILIEEFIDGKMYTIDYYVDEEQRISISKPVYIKLGIDYGINDFSNISRFISKRVEQEVDQEKLSQFIEKTVKGGGIKNTFVHHEFKINSKGTFKTIETNGRIGGFRLDMYQVGYELNLLRFPFGKGEKDYPLKKNVALFALYPKEEGIFEGYNQDIVSKISQLPSFHRINTGVKEIGTVIGLTKDGYAKVGSIELANENENEFLNDVKIVEELYFDILRTKKG